MLYIVMATDVRDLRPKGPARSGTALLPFAKSASLSVAVGPVALVVTECITVTSAMRKHARWQHSSVSAILGGGANKPPPYQRRPKEDKGHPDQGKKHDGEEALASRWGLRGKKGKSMEDNPLMASFTRLRSDLKDCKGIASYSSYDGIAINLNCRQTYRRLILQLSCIPSSSLFARPPHLRP